MFCYQGSLETKEYMIPELHKTLQLSQDQVCVLAALLGNFLLPESELQDFYKRVIPSNKESGEVNIFKLKLKQRFLFCGIRYSYL